MQLATDEILMKHGWESERSARALGIGTTQDTVGTENWLYGGYVTVRHCVPGEFTDFEQEATKVTKVGAENRC
jgi:hypothetical protein